MTTQTQARGERGRFAKVKGPSIAPQFVPVWAGVAVAAAATILWGVRHAAGPGVPLGIIAVSGAFAVVLVRSNPAAVRATVTAAAWAAAWTMWGPSWLLTAVGASLLALVSIPYWRARYIPNTPAALTEQEAPAAPVAVERTAAEVVNDRWNRRIAKNGTLAGSRLELIETNGRVHQLLVHLVPGKQTYTQLSSAREAIASAMEVPEPCVTIERGPHTAAGLLTVITDVRSSEPVMYPGPRFDPKTGMVGLAKYDDTGIEAALSIVAKNGTFGATFCGDQGSGKTAAMEQVALSLLASGYFVGIYIDPQDGFSSPAMMQACKYRATNIEEAAKIIRQLPLLRRVRQAIFKRLGWNGYTLSKKHPAFMVIIDEFQEVAGELSPEDQAILVKLAKTLRKVGGLLMVGTQTVGLQSFGGNSDLRAQLMSRNVVYFYTSSKVQGRLSGDNEFDPSTLPSGTPGYGYLKELRIDGELVTRAAPIRAYHLGDKEDFDGKNPGVVWLERLRAEHEFAEWPDAEVGALAPAFADLDDDGLKELAERNLIEACESVARGDLNIESLDLYTVPLPAAKPKAQGSGFSLPSARIGGPVDEEEYPEKTAAILGAIRSGAWGTAEIRRTATVEVSASHVEQTLPRLVDDGEIERIGHGHYHAVGEAACRRPGCGG